MAVQSGSVTMGQWAALANEPLVEAVTWSLIDAGSVMARDIPFATNETLYVNGVRFEGGLPAIKWAMLNEEGQTVSMAPTAFQEQVYIIRNQVDIDEFLVRDRNAIRDVRATQVEGLLRSIAFDWNEKFIGNNHSTGDANAIVGLKARIANGNLYGVRSENLINGSSVDLSTATGLTSANGVQNANAFLELLDQLLFSVDAPDGSPQVVLYMNEVLKRRINRAVRTLGTQGGFDESQDMYQRTVTTYKGCPIRDIGRKRDQVSLIITNTELSTGLADTGGANTSIYAVNYSDGHFGGWQFGPLVAQNLGQLNTGMQYRTYLSWAGGMINYSSRSLGRLYGIKMT
jgi:hypothetical protein